MELEERESATGGSGEDMQQRQVVVSAAFGSLGDLNPMCARASCFSRSLWHNSSCFLYCLEGTRGTHLHRNGRLGLALELQKDKNNRVRARAHSQLLLMLA